MASDPVFLGDVTADGRLVLLDDEAAKRKDHLRSLAGQRVDVIVRAHKDTRSERANAYYWRCVLTVMSEDGSDGDQSPEEIHDAMCEMFLPNEKKRVEFYNLMTDQKLGVEVDSRRSSKLKGDEFYTFVEKVRKFALEFMGIRTEDPDPEYWRHRRAA
jgi:hypothetical protein